MSLTNDCRLLSHKIALIFSESANFGDYLDFIFIVDNSLYSKINKSFLIEVTDIYKIE